MRTRDLVLLCSAAALVVAVAMPMLGVHASEVAPPAPPAPAVEPVEAERVPAVKPVDGGPAPRDNPEPEAGVFHPKEGVSTTGWTSGVIRGDIALAVSVLDKVQNLQVVVDELRPLDNKEHKQPFHFIQRVPIGVGTPTFEVRGVDFSPYGYVVRAYAPGTNGNQVTIQVNEQRPLVDDVRLAITAAAPFSLLLRDQESLAVTATEVRMVPIGPPLGRPPLAAVSDNYGSAVFETALAGDYQVYVGPTSAPLIEPQRITVQAAGYKVGANGVQPQGQTLVVPRGVALTVLCTDPYGSPLEGVAVRLEATDRKVRTEDEGVTDPRGRCEFPRVLGGVWQVDATKPGYETRSRQLTIDPKQAPPELQLQLPRR
jgi:hypothetical protein